MGNLTVKKETDLEIFAAPCVQKIIETSIALAKEDFLKGNYSLRLIPTSSRKPVRYRYTVDSGHDVDTLADMQRIIFKASGIALARLEDLREALDKGQEIHHMILESLVKEREQKNGYFDKYGTPL